MSAEPREEHTYVEQYEGHSIVYDHGPTSWGAFVEDLPTCVAVAETFEECERLIKDGIAIYLDELQAHQTGISSSRP